MNRKERAAMIDGILGRDGKALPDNLPPGGNRNKWKAMMGVARLNLGPAGDVLRCLIDRGGNCWPSEEFIAGWLGRPVATVRGQIRTLRLHEPQLVDVIDRRHQNKSNVYVIKWEPLFAAYDEIKAFEKEWKAGANKRKAARKPRTATDQKCTVVPPNHRADVNGGHRADVNDKPIKGNLESRNLRYEIAADAAARETRIPDGFKPSEWTILVLRDKGYQEKHITAQASAFLDHHLASGELHAEADWQDAFRAWVADPPVMPSGHDGPTLDLIANGNGSEAQAQGPAETYAHRKKRREAESVRKYYTDRGREAPTGEKLQ
jgi:hypothetical protein